MFPEPAEDRAQPPGRGYGAEPAIPGAQRVEVPARRRAEGHAGHWSGGPGVGLCRASGVAVHRQPRLPHGAAGGHLVAVGQAPADPRPGELLAGLQQRHGLRPAGARPQVGPLHGLRPRPQQLPAVPDGVQARLLRGRPGPVRLQGLRHLALRGQGHGPEPAAGPGDVLRGLGEGRIRQEVVDAVIGGRVHRRRRQRVLPGPPGARELRRHQRGELHHLQPHLVLLGLARSELHAGQPGRGCTLVPVRRLPVLADADVEIQAESHCFDRRDLHTNGACLLYHGLGQRLAVSSGPLLQFRFHSRWLRAVRWHRQRSAEPCVREGRWERRHRRGQVLLGHRGRVRHEPRRPRGLAVGSKRSSGEVVVARRSAAGFRWRFRHRRG
mmetsp:Transcript_104566/g.320303  ORF Transcript_104566/g.320303 Transcript_104566/m.320303 type:complete len:382 (+) Transcript_104566:781-1926(+)